MDCQPPLVTESRPPVTLAKLWVWSRDYLNVDAIANQRWIVGQQVCYRQMIKLLHKNWRKSSPKLHCQMLWWGSPWYSTCKRSLVHRTSSPVTPTLGFAPALQFVPSVVWVTISSEKIFTVDEFGALYCSVAVPTCSATWPHGRRHGCRRFPRLRHALGGLPHRFTPWRLTCDSRTPMSSECHGRTPLWLSPSPRPPAHLLKIGRHRWWTL
jgi:hypothetical protein